jgi:3-isopropylmalate dehydrogenase
MVNIAVLPGDGIGKEVIDVGVDVIKAVAEARPSFEVAFEWLDYGADRYLRDGVGLPEQELYGIAERNDAIYLGAVGDPRVPGSEHAREIVLETRFRLDLYVNLRPCKLLDPRFCPLKDKGPDDVDFVVFRENTEGLYVGAGGVFKRGTADEVAIQESINTRKGVERIIRFAYQYADQQGFGKVCMSDKSNALRHAHDLWQRVWKEVAAEYPHIESRHLYIDVLAMELVRHPEDFEVIVTSNLFGDIVTDLGAALQGGLGMAASANINPERGIGMFEPVHGSAPDIAGQNKANPLAAVATAGLLLNSVGKPREARIIEAAVAKALLEGKTTADLGGSLSTSEVRDFLVSVVPELAAEV